MIPSIRKLAELMSRNLRQLRVIALLINGVHFGEHSVWISFNLPLFFWLKQNEDLNRADLDLEAARADLSAVRTRTAAELTISFRHAQFDYQNAITYRDTIVPEGLKAFESALADFPDKKEEFATVSYLRNQLNLARTSYLEAVNSFLRSGSQLSKKLANHCPK